VSYTLLGVDGKRHQRLVPGKLGGHRKTKIYGRLDCRAACAAIARGGYVRWRVFFARESDAIAAGYRPCAVCMPVEYVKWRRGSRRAR
jgi:methylphosphotriester-DNA--protein-cysteine methyltransferase